MNVKRFVLGFLLVCLLGTTGCEYQEGNGGKVIDAKDIQQSDKARVEDPQADASTVAALVEDNTAFAMDLYQQLAGKGGGNLFYSPYSISVALAMTYGGAAGTTADQMARTMHFALGQEELHAAMNALDQSLKSYQGDIAQDSKFRLNLVNSIWGQKGYNFLPEFLDLLAENYGAGLRTQDFAGNPEGSRKTINDWVSAETEQKIKDLIPSGTLNELTRMVLVNAIYFYGDWMLPFKEADTREDSFYPLAGDSVKVEMMNQTGNFQYGEGENYQAVMLPYRDTDLEMLILLPAEGAFTDFEKSLTPQSLAALNNQLLMRDVKLSLPKFHLEQGLSLAQTLSEMGMPEAFSMAADFSGMDGSKELYLQDVVHKAFVDVDEKGTEAAAATAVIVGMKALPPQEGVVMRIDRPFVFMIRDRSNQSILFMGRVTNPTP